MSTRRGPSLDERVPLPRAVATSARSNAKVLPNDTAAERSRYSLRADHDGALPYDAYAPAARAARLRRRLLEGLPGRGQEPDAAPAADRPAACRGRSATGRPTRACCAGRCCRPTIRRRGSTRRTSARRRSARATPGRGAAASTSASRPRSTASPTRTTAFSSSARPASARTRSAASPGRSSRPAGTVTPKVSFNAASYSLDLPLADGRRSASRVIPTVSVDSAWTLERETELLRPRRAPDARAAPVLRQHAVSAPGRPAELRLGAEGLQLRFALHREPVLGRRPRLRLEPADRRRDLARARSRHRRRGACASASPSAIASATSASRPTTCR